MSQIAEKLALEGKIKRFNRIVIDVAKMRLAEQDDVGLILLEKVANAYLECLQVELQAITFPWPSSLVADLPVEGYIRDTLTQAGIEKTVDIPPTEKKLVSKAPTRIGFSVIEALKKTSNGHWPFA